MKRLTTSQQIRWAVLNCPTLLPSFVNNPHLNKHTTLGILHDLIPRRTSVEIECFESLVTGLGIHETEGIKIQGSNQHIPVLRYKCIEKKYGLREFAIDGPSVFDIDYTEHKISINNYTQITGLYKILKDMSKYCVLNTKSGCHVHLDICPTLTRIPIDTIQSYFDKCCKDGRIEKIFGKYIGKPTDQQACSRNTKYGWVNINTQYGTAEFRCGEMTFDYNTIIKWYIGVNRLLTILEKKYAERKKKMQSYAGISPSVRVVGRIQL